MAEFDNVDSLENNVKLQLNGSSSYNFITNKELLKSYYLGSPIKGNFVQNILALALLEDTHKDFLSLKYLVPINMMQNNDVISIIKCFELLENCLYSEFWSHYSACEQIFSSISSFSAKMQKSILQNLSTTFKSIAIGTFQQFLNLNSSNIASFCSLHSSLIEVLIDTFRNLFQF
jgi:hypothetical protein